MEIFQITQKTFFSENGIEYQATINEFDEILLYSSKRRASLRCRTWIKETEENGYIRKAYECRKNYKIWRFEKSDGHAIEYSLIKKKPL